jgi:hypothetical protein
MHTASAAAAAASLKENQGLSKGQKLYISKLYLAS